jgi:hypothetical protein
MSVTYVKELSISTRPPDPFLTHFAGGNKKMIVFGRYHDRVQRIHGRNWRLIKGRPVRKLPECKIARPQAVDLWPVAPVKRYR